MIAIAAERGLLEDPLYADALAELHVRCESIRLLAWKGLTDVERYGQPGPGGLAGEVAVVGHQPAPHAARGRHRRPRRADGRATSWSYELLRARGNTIEGGTTEVLKNIVAERVLGLPRLKVAA